MHTLKTYSQVKASIVDLRAEDMSFYIASHSSAKGFESVTAQSLQHWMSYLDFYV
jgi:hypothetical protein